MHGRNKKGKDNHIWFTFFHIVFFIILTPIFLILEYLIINSSELDTWDQLIFWFIFFIFAGWPYYIYFLLWIKKNINIRLHNKYLQDLKSFNQKLFQQCFDEVSFDEVESIIQNINWVVSQIGKNRKFYYFSDIFLHAEYTYIFQILQILQSEVENYISNERNILENTRSAVEKNLKGKPELLTVSETQKLRLDRQIEQFEELENKLVQI